MREREQTEKDVRQKSPRKEQIHDDISFRTFRTKEHLRRWMPQSRMGKRHSEYVRGELRARPELLPGIEILISFSRYGICSAEGSFKEKKWNWSIRVLQKFHLLREVLTFRKRCSIFRA